MRICWALFLVSSLVYSSETEEEALFLRRIADFWQEKEYQIAKSQIEEFISAYPESSYCDALSAALGDLFLREKNFSSALSCYTRVQAPEFYHRVFLNRMQCLYEMQWYATLADECEGYLQNGPNLHATYFLAIALYHQCLNASKEPDQLLKLAERAKPHFEALSGSEFSTEIAQGYAHLCCVLKDFRKASEIYVGLSQKERASEEEMLFQAGLIQSEYDKPLAIQTFDQIAKLGGKKAKEALYNRLVLTFDLGRYDELIRSDFSHQIPPEKRATARLFVGRSFLHLKEYEKAIAELKKYVEEVPVSEPFHTALLSLLDASYQSGALASLDYGIEKLRAAYPEDPELPKACFSRAQILKKQGEVVKAKEELDRLLTQFPQFAQKAQVVFELTHLDYKGKAWAACYERARTFLTEFPEHELSLFAWRYLISSSAEIAAQSGEFRERLIEDLEAFLKLPLPPSERGEWEVLLAKVYYELGRYEQAVARLETVQTPNGRLLLSLCYRDGYKDLERFCTLAESALAEKADLIDLGQIHASLFNAYLDLSQIEKGAEHLYAAFVGNTEIKIENLLWLADLYLSRLQEEENNFPLAHRAALILTQCKDHPCKAALQGPEAILCKLAKVYSILGRTDDEIALLETLQSPGPEAQLLLAEGYARKGVVEKATQMFDAIVSSSATLRSPVSASASLQAARLKLGGEHPDLGKIAAELKSLVVQKNFEGEPLYLEAALDYVDVQSRGDWGKRVALLQKTKLDFEQRDDLLSKDYHEARARFPRKDRIYQGYLQFIEADIFAAQSRLEPKDQKELKGKSKDLLLQIVKEQTARALLERTHRLLTSMDEPQAKT